LFEGAFIMIREVLGIQGQVYIINHQGRRRTLRAGERIGNGDRLELADGAELMLRHADGHQETLHGGRARLPQQIESGMGEELAISQVKAAVVRTARSASSSPRQILDEARPEASLQSGDGDNQGHSFVRVERMHFAMPQGGIELVTYEPLPARLMREASSIAQDTAERVVQSPIDLSLSPLRLPLLSFLLEGADRDHWPVAGRPAGIHKQTIVLDSYIWSSDGQRLLALPGDSSLYASERIDRSKHQVVSDSHATLEIRYLRAMETTDAAGATLHQYEVTQKTKGGAENIPDGAQVENTWHLGLANSKTQTVTTWIDGNVDRGVGQTFTVEDRLPIRFGGPVLDVVEVNEDGELIRAHGLRVMRCADLQDEGQAALSAELLPLDPVQQPFPSSHETLNRLIGAMENAVVV
jgi:hypothetical protein